MKIFSMIRALWKRRSQPDLESLREALSWRARLHRLDVEPSEPLDRAYFRANRDAVRAAVQGYGPDDADPSLSAGARMVANIASVHLIAICEAAAKGDPKPYKNYYDLGKHHLGEPTKRELVDQSLPVASYRNVYFCAAELNGSGIRFYGEYCLVLKPRAADAGTTILERNSYDLVREPLLQIVQAEPTGSAQSTTRRKLANSMAGNWQTDLPGMVTLKIAPGQPLHARRLTTGLIAQGILADEDYIEVLREGSFAPADLQEVRISLADAALQSRILDQSRQGDPPTLEELLWTKRRKDAERALSNAGIRIKVVTTMGRTRT